MIALTNPIQIPHTKVERLQWYAEHLRRMKQRHLVNIATSPERNVIDPNERIVAVLLIAEQGIESQDAVKPLLDLLSDENDYPLTQGTTHEKENDAMLRSETALALAKYGVKSKEFKTTLISILKSIVCDPVFIAKSGPSMYFMNFACALYIADRDSIINEPVMKAYIREDELDQYIASSLK